MLLQFVERRLAEGEQLKSYKAAFGAALATLAFLSLAVASSPATAAPARPDSKQNLNKGHFEKNAQITAFWQWFQKHQPELSAMQSPDAPIFADIGRQIKNIDKDLVFEIAPLPAGKKCLAVSANCNAALFPLVENTVAAAPVIKDWKVEAFRRRVPAGMLKQLSISAQPAVNGKIIPNAAPIGVAVKDMRFKLAWEGDKARLTLFIKNYKADGPQSHMAELMVQQAVGEYDSVKKVLEIKCQADSAAAAKDAKPFEELPAALDKVAKK